MLFNYTIFNFDFCDIPDFNLITSQVTITATNTQPCVRFEAVADSLGLEGVENLTLTLSGPPNVQLTTPTADICIQEPDGNEKRLTHFLRYKSLAYCCSYGSD